MPRKFIWRNPVNSRSAPEASVSFCCNGRQMLGGWQWLSRFSAAYFDGVLLQTMLRYTEEQLHAYMARRSPRQLSDDASNAKPAPGVPGKDAAKGEAITGSPINEASHKQEGRVVSNFVMLPYPVSCNRYWRNFRGRMVVSSEAKAYKAKVIWSFDALEIIPTSKPVELSMKLHPKLTTKGKASRTLIDLDNCIKVCLDALQGVLYVNDNQVIKLTAEIGEPVDGGGLSVGII